MNRRRSRCRNYTESERYMLLKIVEQYMPVVENKKTDNISNYLKNIIWEKISQDFGKINQWSDRSPQQLRNLYMTMKKNVKKISNFSKDDESNDSENKKLAIYEEKLVEMLKNYSTNWEEMENMKEQIQNSVLDGMAECSENEISWTDISKNEGSKELRNVKKLFNLAAEVLISSKLVENLSLKEKLLVKRELQEKEVQPMEEKNENAKTREILKGRPQPFKINLACKTSIHNKKRKFVDDYRQQKRNLHIDILKLKKQRAELGKEKLKLEIQEKELDLFFKKVKYNIGTSNNNNNV